MNKKIEELWNAHKDILLQYSAKFPSATSRALRRMDLRDTQEITPENAGEFCQCLWDELPDELYIHMDGFNQLCDIAELYCFGEDDVDDVQ